MYACGFAKQYPERDDNLLCVAVVLETAVVVKTFSDSS